MTAKLAALIISQSTNKYIGYKILRLQVHSVTNKIIIVPIQPSSKFKYIINRTPIYIYNAIPNSRICMPGKNSNIVVRYQNQKHTY